jgi:hypothetical protein
MRDAAAVRYRQEELNVTQSETHGGPL